MQQGKPALLLPWLGYKITLLLTISLVYIVRLLFFRVPTTKWEVLILGKLRQLKIINYLNKIPIGYQFITLNSLLHFIKKCLLSIRGFYCLFLVVLYHKLVIYQSTQNHVPIVLTNMTHNTTYTSCKPR